MLRVLLPVGLLLSSAAGFAQSSLKFLPVTPQEAPERYLVPIENRSIFLEPLHNDYTLVMFAEKMPVFKGDKKGLLNYLKEQLRYPPAAIAQGVAGTVFVAFTVQSDGSVADARVLKGIGYGCDEEALRVVRAMPPWEPATQSGRPIPISYSLPIRFQWPQPEKPRKKGLRLPFRRTFSR